MPALLLLDAQGVILSGSWMRALILSVGVLGKLSHMRGKVFKIINY